MAESDDGVFALVFVPVDDEKLVKNRLHLDLASQTLDDQAAIVDRLLASGASRVEIGQGESPDGVPWVVLADPEGNELCVLEPWDRYLGASLAVDRRRLRGPAARVAEFWRGVIGWDGRSPSTTAP